MQEKIFIAIFKGLIITAMIPPIYDYYSSPTVTRKEIVDRFNRFEESVKMMERPKK